MSAESNPPASQDPHLLRDYLAEQAGKRARYGETDCGPFVGNWMERATGRNPAASLIGTYFDARGSREIIRRSGGLRALGRKLADEHGLKEIEAPTVGDIGVVKVGKRTQFAINVAPGQWALKSEKGVVIGPAKHLRAWTFKGGRSLGGFEIGVAILNLLGLSEFIGATILGVSLPTIVGSVVLTAPSSGAQFRIRSLA